MVTSTIGRSVTLGEAAQGQRRGNLVPHRRHDLLTEEQLQDLEARVKRAGGTERSQFANRSSFSPPDIPHAHIVPLVHQFHQRVGYVHGEDFHGKADRRHGEFHDCEEHQDLHEQRLVAGHVFIYVQKCFMSVHS